MKALVLFLVSFCLSLGAGEIPFESQSLNSPSSVLDLSKQRYDPNQQWSKARLNIHIQEPRLGNPHRYSELTIDNSSGFFELNRPTEAGMVTRRFRNGKSIVLLDGSETIAKEVVEQYRLNAERNSGYQKFYTLMYGLPMSLTDVVVEKVGEARQVKFKGEEVYQIDLKLREAVISDSWSLLINMDTYGLEGLIIRHTDSPETEDELIEFDKMYVWDGTTIPRMRHWYKEESGEYLGSDIIIKSLRNED